MHDLLTQNDHIQDIYKPKQQQQQHQQKKQQQQQQTTEKNV